MRKIILLNKDRYFTKAALPCGGAEGDWEGEAVTLPHTWNAEDGQDGGNDYHRGKCWYMRKLEAPELEPVGEA